jgi:glutathione S-transferase
LKANGDGEGWFVGGTPTLADLSVFSFCYDIFLRPSKFEVGAHYFDGVPKLKAFIERFLNSVPEFKTYLESRDDDIKF